MTECSINDIRKLMDEFPSEYRIKMIENGMTYQGVIITDDDGKPAALIIKDGKLYKFTNLVPVSATNTIKGGRRKTWTT